MKLNRLTIIVTMVSIFLASCSAKTKDPYPEINLPVYTDSYDISTAFDESIFGKTLRFSVQKQFPAFNVQKYYESFLSEKGFSELKDFPYSDKTWVKFNSKSLKWDIVADSPPARYFRAWVDNHQNLIFKLTLRYDDNTDKLSVTCFLHPYAQHDLFSQFDKWVSDKGKDQEFAEFLTNYRKPNNKVDIERALEENPKSELIQKFAKAAEQDKQNIEAAYKAYKETIQSK